MQSEAWDKVAHDLDFDLEIDFDGMRAYISEKSHILDFGCGYGRISNKLSTLGYSNVVGVDSSFEMIKRGAKEFPEVKLLHSPEMPLEFSPNSFDLVIVCGVLTCIPDRALRERVILELHRVLKAGGILHIVEFCGDTEPTIKSSFGVEMLHSTKRNYSDLLTTFSILSSCVKRTSTISGREAKSVSFFAQKNT
ncbi:MAG: class I SAM-dependent methyltransferase [Agarilytica sp.]